jgi:ribonuclease HI
VAELLAYVHALGWLTRGAWRASARAITARRVVIITDSQNVARQGTRTVQGTYQAQRKELRWLWRSIDDLVNDHNLHLVFVHRPRNLLALNRLVDLMAGAVARRVNQVTLASILSELHQPPLSVTDVLPFREARAAHPGEAPG